MAKKLRSPEDMVAGLKTAAVQIKNARIECDREADDSIQIEALRDVLQWQTKELPKWAESVGVDPNECLGYTVPVSKAVLKLTKTKN